VCLEAEYEGVGTGICCSRLLLSGRSRWKWHYGPVFLQPVRERCLLLEFSSLGLWEGWDLIPRSKLSIWKIE